MKKTLTALMLCASFYAYSQNSNGTTCPVGYWEKDKNGKQHWKCIEPLPVTLISFEVRQQENAAVLIWKVADVQNHDYYQVERSYNGRDFTAIGTTRELTYTDNTITAPAYYRLRQFDINGKSEVHLTRFIQFEPKSYHVTDLLTGSSTVYQRFSQVQRNRLILLNNRKTIVIK